MNIFFLDLDPFHSLHPLHINHINLYHLINNLFLNILLLLLHHFQLSYLYQIDLKFFIESLIVAVIAEYT